jgi:hypothetical protein
MTTENKALDLFDLFNTNRESEEDGKWLGLHPVTDFKVRAFNAKAVTDLREKLMKPFQTMLRAGLPIPDEKNEEIGLRVISGAVLVEWKGVEIEGEAVSFSAEAAYTLLKKLPKLANQIASASMDASNFREEQREADAGN